MIGLERDPASVEATYFSNLTGKAATLIAKEANMASFLK
jgi:hypothetical protein